MNKLPDFLNYVEEGKVDKGHEALQDFFLSWILRCSQSRYSKDNYLVNYYSKRLVYLLIYGQNIDKRLTVNDDSSFDTFEVLSVKTKRQYGNIDLIAEVQINNGGIIENCLLNIENKVYHKISEHQLPNSLEIVKNNPEWDDFKLVNLVIYTDGCIINKYPDQLDLCLKHGFKYLSLEGDFAEFANFQELGLTGDQMFDRYFI